MGLLPVMQKCGGMPGTFSLPLLVSDPNIHYDTCVTHVPWCLLGLLTSCFLWSRGWGKRSWHCRRMHNHQFYAHVSGKRPILQTAWRRFLAVHDAATMTVTGVSSAASVSSVVIIRRWLTTAPNVSVRSFTLHTKCYVVWSQSSLHPRQTYISDCPTLYPRSYHGSNFGVTGATESFHNDNRQCH